MTYPFPPPYGAAAPDSVPEQHQVAPVGPTPKRRSVPAWAVWTAATVLVLGGAGVGVGMWWSNTTSVYVEADAAYDRAFVSAAGAASELRQLTLDEEGEQENVQKILATAHDGLVAAETVDALQAAAGEFTASLDDAAAVLEDAAEKLPDEELTWPWEYTAATEMRQRATTDARSHEEAVETSTVEVETTQTTLREAATALFESAPASAAALEAEQVSARRDDVLAFRTAVDFMSGASRLSTVSSTSATTFEEYANAATALRTSAAEELAEKAGPLLERRLEVEAFARSIAGGVLLDFDWADSVNDAGPDGRVGGTASWDSRGGGSATITLSNTVAERWPDDVPQALVAHEVGHAMAGRCYDKFDWESREENEAWATAWALSMGYTADGNGVSIYGYPRQELIDVAATCR